MNMQNVDRNLKDVGSVIDALGGNAEVARFLDIGASAVSEMKRRGSIHARYFKPIVEMAEQRGVDGVTVDALVDMHDFRKAGR